jgi:hypothetical protein
MISRFDLDLDIDDNKYCRLQAHNLTVGARSRLLRRSKGCHLTPTGIHA